jgi:alpha-mannosidase
MDIPEEMGDDAKYEKSIMTSIKERHGKRSCHTVTLPIVSYITLGKNSKRLDIRTTIDNNAKDHRIRVLFPTYTNAVTHKAETIFEAPERPNAHNKCRTYPSGCEHQQGYVMMTDGKYGLAVANIGLYEYETVGDTIALTLLRAVSEMGDWGVFPTKLSQIQRSVTFEYSVIPYTDESEAVANASSFRIPMLVSQLGKGQSSSAERSIISWNGTSLKPTAFKNKMNSDDLIFRWANYSSSEQTLTIEKNNVINNLYMSNVIEEDLGALTEDNGKWTIKVKPYEIITLGVKSH